MSEQEFETYLEAVARRLALSPGRREEIRDELRGHLEERWAEVDGPGVDRAQAVRRVLEEFGPAERLAVGISRPYRRRVRRIAGTVAASLLLTVLIPLHFPSAPRAGGVDAARARSVAGSGLPLLSLTPLATEVTAGPVEDRASAALERSIAVKLEEVPLSEAFDELREATDANLWVNWVALESEGVERDRPLSMALHDVPFRRVLDLVCAELNAGGPQVAYGVSENVIEISTLSELRAPQADSLTVRRVYDARPILDASWPEGKAPPAATGDGPTERIRARGELARERADLLADLIRSQVDPQQWFANGGLSASVNHFAGLLVVRAPADTQEKVADLIAQLTERLADR